MEEDARNPQNGYGRQEGECETQFRSAVDGLHFRTIGFVAAIAIRRKLEKSVRLTRFAERLPTGYRSSCRSIGGEAGRRWGPAPCGRWALQRYHLGQSHHGRPGSRPNPNGFLQESKGSVQGP